MKRIFQIFVLTKNEQRVVLIVMLGLIAIAFVGYERRVHRVAQQISITAPTPSPGTTPSQ
jgi:hypothetical protein